jgi:hypothetical protein
MILNVLFHGLTPNALLGYPILRYYKKPKKTTNPCCFSANFKAKSLLRAVIGIGAANAGRSIYNGNQRSPKPRGKGAVWAFLSLSVPASGGGEYTGGGAGIGDKDLLARRNRRAGD